MDKNGKTGRRYSLEEKAAAVRLARTLRAELRTQRGEQDSELRRNGASRSGRG